MKKLSVKELQDRLLDHTRWLFDPSQGAQLELNHYDLSDLPGNLLLGRSLVLTNCNLGGNVLSGASLVDSQLRHCQALDAYAAGLSLTNCTLETTSLAGADLTHGLFLRNHWQDCSLVGVDATSTTWHSESLFACDWTGALFHYASLVNTMTRNLVTDRVDFGFAQVVNLTGAGPVVTAENLGPNKRRVFYHAVSDRLWCGCFAGSLELFVEAVQGKYPPRAETQPWYTIIDRCYWARKLVEARQDFAVMEDTLYS